MWNTFLSTYLLCLLSLQEKRTVMDSYERGQLQKCLDNLQKAIKGKRALWPILWPISCVEYTFISGFPIMLIYSNNCKNLLTVCWKIMCACSCQSC